MQKSYNIKKMFDKLDEIKRLSIEVNSICDKLKIDTNKLDFSPMDISCDADEVIACLEVALNEQ